MPWYEGPSLLHHLEHVHVSSDRNLIDVRFPVQYVIRPQSSQYPDYRGYAGTVGSGVLKPGDEVMVLPSGFTTRIAGIDTADGPVGEAFPPMSVTVRLEHDLDVSRGDMICRPHNVPMVTQDIDAMLCWMTDKPLVPGQKLALKHTTRQVRALVKDLQYRLDVNTLHRDETSTQLGLNDIGRVRLRTTAPLFADEYRRNRTTGGLRAARRGDQRDRRGRDRPGRLSDGCRAAHGPSRSARAARRCPRVGWSRHEPVRSARRLPPRSRDHRTPRCRTLRGRHRPGHRGADGGAAARRRLDGRGRPSRRRASRARRDGDRPRVRGPGRSAALLPAPGDRRGVPGVGDAAARAPVATVGHGGPTPGRPAPARAPDGRRSAARTRERRRRTGQGGAAAPGHRAGGPRAGQPCRRRRGTDGRGRAASRRGRLRPGRHGGAAR